MVPLFRAKEMSKLGEWRRLMGWMAANEMRGRYRCKETKIRSGFLPIISVRFISCLRQDSLLVVEGSTSRYSYCFLSEKWAATQTVRCDSESHSGEEVEGHANAGFRPRMLALAERCNSKT